jgi:hypothetical protein
MIKLSDAQLVILSAACARENGSLLPVSSNLNSNAASMVLHSLINKGLAEEVPASRNMPIWREAEDGAPVSLRATAAAYQALGLADTAGEDAEDQAIPKANTRPNSKQAQLIEMLMGIIGGIAFMVFGQVDGNTAVGGCIISVVTLLAGKFATAFDFEFGGSADSEQTRALLAQAPSITEK